MSNTRRTSLTLMSLVIVAIGLAGTGSSQALEGCLAPYPANLCFEVMHPPAADGRGVTAISFYTYNRNHVYAGVDCNDMENDSVLYGYKLGRISAARNHHINRQLC